MDLDFIFRFLKIYFPSGPGLSDNSWFHLIWPHSHLDFLFFLIPNYNDTIAGGWSCTHYSTVSESLTEWICPLWWTCGRWFIDLAPHPSPRPWCVDESSVWRIRQQRPGFQKQAGENEPWRKSEVIIFIISWGSKRGKSNLRVCVCVHLGSAQAVPAACWLAHTSTSGN